MTFLFTGSKTPLALRVPTLTSYELYIYAHTDVLVQLNRALPLSDCQQPTANQEFNTYLAMLLLIFCQNSFPATRSTNIKKRKRPAQSYILLFNVK